jgi:nucleotide-binding universal stress UspA family protein
MRSEAFTRILLATDGTPPAENAEAVAASLALAANGKVRVVHAWSIETRHEAEAFAAAAVERLHGFGVQADGAVSRSDHNHIAEAIVDAAREFDAEVIVAGSRGLSDWQSLRRHSVSHKILAEFDRPVLIVRGRDGEYVHTARKVLLAIAGGDDLEPGVRAAAAVAAAPGSKVVVVHVAQAIIGVHGFSYMESGEEIETTVSKACAMLRDTGIPTEPMIAEPGAVASVVAETAAQVGADIIVIGSSRMGDLASMLLGSVTHQLLRATDRPVLVAGRSDG